MSSGKGIHRHVWALNKEKFILHHCIIEQCRPPKDVHIPLWIPRACGYVTRQREIKVADGIMLDNQLALNNRDYPGLSRWAPCTHKGPYKWKSHWSEETKVFIV